ncbi:MAG: type II secretion system protein GspM [Thermoleophilaceae bacterium]
MSITARDKKILAVLALVGVLAGYWFLLLSPKREEVAKVEEEVSAQQSQRDAAVAQARAAETAQASFESDYAELVRLGKAIPSSVDMPSLLIQLDRAAGGSHIDVDKVTVGARVPASGAAPAPAPPAEGAAAPGGEEAGSAPGQAAEGAAEDAQQVDTQTSESARDGSVPVGGGAGTAPAAAAGAPGVAGLDSVPIDFEFTGSFFDLADFFHELKRFVHLGEDGIVVRGRLMTIDNFSFGAGEGGDSGDGGLKATVKATVYLAPKAEGATAGATPAGPAPQGDATSAAAPTPPTAAVQP